jgi:hypothetical protein
MSGVVDSVRPGSVVVVVVVVLGVILPVGACDDCGFRDMTSIGRADLIDDI